ncbi:GrpB family protein [Paenibacillus sp. DMB20]|uniref:GrpB family protein n=1 Tax=Paenibacillus sp. DMB20 TaxID=1642570 RepID=UPI000627BBC9|nr:GrpB family protein [Paenibacillus sp. DMB20]KKO52699.1 hypothetical protein XI25_17835 [Paenibacillus sp. DMB20]
MRGKVEIHEYSPDWPKSYEAERDAILTALQGICEHMEHIGSTSVPGLAAKPVIDMMAGVQELCLVTPDYIKRLEAAGYEYVHKPEFPERMFFRKGLWRAGTHHLHIYEHGGEHWLQNIRFRDYLIKHPEARREYAALKKELQTLYSDDRVRYTEVKAPFISNMMERARRDWESANH